MKRILSLLFSVLLLFCISVPAFAEDVENTKSADVTIVQPKTRAVTVPPSPDEYITYPYSYYINTETSLRSTILCIPKAVRNPTDYWGAYYFFRSHGVSIAYSDFLKGQSFWIDYQDGFSLFYNPSTSETSSLHHFYSSRVSLSSKEITTSGIGLYLVGKSNPPTPYRQPFLSVSDTVATLLNDTYTKYANVDYKNYALQPLSWSHKFTYDLSLIDSWGLAPEEKADLISHLGGTPPVDPATKSKVKILSLEDGRESPFKFYQTNSVSLGCEYAVPSTVGNDYTISISGFQESSPEITEHMKGAASDVPGLYYGHFKFKGTCAYDVNTPITVTITDKNSKTYTSTASVTCASTTKPISTEFRAKILLPKDGFKQSKLNAIAMRTYYKVPYDGDMKHVNIQFSGYSGGNSFVDLHDVTVLDGGKALEGYLNVSGAVPWNLPTDLSITVTDYLGKTYTDKISVICYDDFVDQDNDGSDDRTGQDEWTGNPDFNKPPIPDPSVGIDPIETIKSASSFLGSFPDFLASLFPYVPTYIWIIIAAGFAVIVAMRILGR